MIYSLNRRRGRKRSFSGRTGSSMFLSETQRPVEKSDRDVRLRGPFEFLSETGIENQRTNHGNMSSSGTASRGSIPAEYFPGKGGFPFPMNPISRYPLRKQLCRTRPAPSCRNEKNFIWPQSERGMKTRKILTSVLHIAAACGLEPAAFLDAFLNDSRNASILFS